MMDPNFFQTKIAVSKAFPGRKLPMTRLHQLYRDIYSIKPKLRNGGNIIQEEERLSLYRRGENTIIADSKMEKLINKYLDSENVDLFEENNLDLKKKVNSTINPLLHRIKTEENSISKKSDSSQHNLDQDAKDRSMVRKSQFYLSGEIKNPDHEVDSVFETKIKPTKWSDSVEQLRNNIARLGAKSNKFSGRLPEASLNDIETPSKRDTTNMQIKVYLHRVGIGHNKSAIEQIGNYMKSSKNSRRSDGLYLDSHNKINSAIIALNDESTMDGGLMPPKLRTRQGNHYGSVGTVSLNPSPEPSKSALPIIGRKSSNAELAQPKYVKERTFPAEQEMGKLFQSCKIMQNNINKLDKRLKRGEKKVVKKLNKLDSTLQQVMKVNFLPEEFILGDNL